MTNEKVEVIEPVYENEFYFIKIGKSTHSDKSIMCYQVIHKEHGVIESETSVLGVAISNADDFAEGLKDLLGDNEKRVMTLN